MLSANSLAFLFGFCETHAVSVFVPLLLGHQLAAVYTVLSLITRLVARLRACDSYHSSHRYRYRNTEHRSRF
jgi:hypothetical protein